MIIPFIFLQIASVMAIFFFLRMLLHKQLELGIRRIKKMDEENLKRETELNEKLKNHDKEYAAKIGEAEKNAGAIIEEAKEEAKKIREEGRISAKDESKKIISSGLQEKEKVLGEADSRIMAKTVDIAQEILKKIFSEDDMRQFRVKLSKEVIDYIVGAKEVGALLEASESAEVMSAEPLTDQEKKYILKAIKEKGNAKTEVKFTMEKGLTGGLTLKIGKRVIDGSIAYRVSKAAAALKEELR